MALSTDTIQTLVLLWVFTWLAMFLMGVRLLMRKIRVQKLDLSDKITVVCMICLLARLAFVHVVLIWGTNNIPQRVRASRKFSSTEIYQREIGSKLIITSRTFYNTYLWLQKGVVMILYQRILFVHKRTGIIINAYWGILGATYIVIQVVTFTDCHPLRLYWQVMPDPGTCSQAVGQLLVVGGLNIFTDIILIILPLPALLKIKRSGGAKFRVLFLFSLGIFLVIITVIRLPFNFKESGMQVNRTTWASVESFTAAFVANIPTLYALRKALPEKPNNIEQAETPPLPEIEKTDKRSLGGSSATGDSQTKYEHTPTKNALTKGKMPMHERRKAMFIPPVPPKDETMMSGTARKARIKDGKIEYVTNERERAMDWATDEQISKGVARKAKIINGKVEYVGENVKRYTVDDWEDNIILDHMDLKDIVKDGEMDSCFEARVSDSPDWDIEKRGSSGTLIISSPRF